MLQDEDSDDEDNGGSPETTNTDITVNCTSLRYEVPIRFAKFTLRKQPRGCRLKRKPQPFVEDLHYSCFSADSRSHFHDLCTSGKETYVGSSVNPFLGNGLFAAQNIKAGDFIVVYHGSRLSQQESSARQKAGYPATYILDLPKGVAIDAMGYPMGAGMANHSCRPNSRLRHGYLRGKERAPYGYLQAVTDITIGTEITCNYGYLRQLSEEELNELLKSGRYIRCRCLQLGCRKIFCPLD